MADLAPHEAQTFIRKKFSRPDDGTNYEAKARHLFAEAVAKGLLKMSDIEVRLTRDSLVLATKGLTPVDGTDVMGWRPFHVKQIMSPTLSVCDEGAQEDFQLLLNDMVTGKVPVAARVFLFTSGMAVYVHNRIQGKQRLIHPPLILQRIAFTADANLSKPHMGAALH